MIILMDTGNDDPGKSSRTRTVVVVVVDVVASLTWFILFYSDHRVKGKINNNISGDEERAAVL